jgi:GDPmannose 4,6-dehydratase
MLDEMIVEMVSSHLEKAKQHALLEKHGYSLTVGME